MPHRDPSDYLSLIKSKTFENTLSNALGDGLLDCISNPSEEIHYEGSDGTGQNSEKGTMEINNGGSK
jgi:hypothetical protein